MPKKRVLFIDSDTAFVEQWSRIIERFGIEVIKHQDGSSGLILAKTYQPDLIVLGLELRDMNGYLVCKRLREDAVTRSIPLFVTSSTATQKDFAKHQKLRVRADEYFHKPVDEKSFVEKINALLGVSLETEAEGVKKSSVPSVTVDDAELIALKEKVKSLEVDIELLRKDLEDAHNSRKELAESLGLQLDSERAKVKQLQDENELLKEQIRILKDEKQELSRIVDRVDSENKRKEREYQEKLSIQEIKLKELDRIKESFVNSEMEKEKYKTEISQFRSELTKFKDRVVELEEIVREKDKELAQIDALSERVKELEDSVTALTDEKEKLESELAGIRKENSEELTSLMDKLNNLTEEKAELASAFDRTKSELENLQDLLREKEVSLERAISEMSLLKEMLKSKDATINGKEAIILELNQKVESQLSVIEETQKQLKEKEEMIEDLNQRLIHVEERRQGEDELKERIKELESQIAEKDEELLRAKGSAERISELESELNRTKSNEEDLKRRLSELEELRKKDEEFLNTLDNVVKEKDKLLKRVKELEWENVKKAEAYNVALEQEIISLKGQLKEKEQEVKNLKELVDVQMEEKLALEKELKEIKSSVMVNRESISPEKKEEEATEEELLVLDESKVIEPSKEATMEDSELVNMLENIWEESKGQDAVVQGQQPQEEFFEEMETIAVGAEEKEDPESIEWKQIIDKYNNIFNLIFVKLVPEKGKEQAEAIWREFLSEQDEGEKVIFENVCINDDGSLSASEILKNLKKISERGRIGKIAGLDNLYINQRLKSKLNEFVDFMIIIAKKKLDSADSEDLIKAVKDRLKSIK